MCYFTYYLVIMRIEVSEAENIMGTAISEDLCITFESELYGNSYYWASTNASGVDNRELTLTTEPVSPNSYFRVK